MIKRLVLSLLGVALIALLLSQLWYLGQVLALRADNPASSAYMQRALAQGAVNQQWRDYSDINDSLKRAVLVAEDSGFMRHRGFEWAGIRHAWRENRKAGKAVVGGSTLSQQLAKNLFLSGQRSYLRKLQEASITVMLELTLSKERILELYLNVAQWGHQIYGAEAAAQHYYQVSASQLNPRQASKLAAKLPRPNVYHFQGPSDYLRERADWIEAQLHLVAIPSPRPWPAPIDSGKPADDALENPQ